MRFLNVAKAILRRKSDGKYLILRASKWEERPDRSQQHDLPGGVVEKNETPEIGCMREIQEESGIAVAAADLQLVYAHTFQSNRDEASITRLLYFIEVEGSPEVTLSWEHEGYEWMSADEVLAMDMHQPYADIFEYLNKINVLI